MNIIYRRKKKMKVIDFHTHPYLSGEEFLNFYPECFEPSPSQMKEDIEKAGICRAAGCVLLKRSYTPDEGFSYIRECNDKALELKKRYAELQGLIDRFVTRTRNAKEFAALIDAQNIAPEQTHEICARHMEGNTKEAAQLQIKMMEMIAALFCEVNPIPVKKALELLGFYGPHLRRPLTEMEPANTERLKKAMIETGIL